MSNRHCCINDTAQHKVKPSPFLNSKTANIFGESLTKKHATSIIYIRVLLSTILTPDKDTETLCSNPTFSISFYRTVFYTILIFGETSTSCGDPIHIYTYIYIYIYIYNVVLLFILLTLFKIVNLIDFILNQTSITPCLIIHLLVNLKGFLDEKIVYPILILVKL